MTSWPSVTHVKTALALRQVKARKAASCDESTMTLAEFLAVNVPRYTSYPTAPHFNATVAPDTTRRWLSALPGDASLSLYVHIPFCDSLCWFCGCNMSVVNHYGPVAAYVDVLLREIEIVADALGGPRAVSHLHFGGGSPTILSAGDLGGIMSALRTRFAILPTAEIAVEIDPRGLSPVTVEAWAAAGVTRASIGVQDVNPEVQRAVNRWQPVSVTRDAVTWLRAAGIHAVNLDLMYGLPLQTVEGLRRTVEEAIALAPQRLALFGYAHVPGMKRHQRLIADCSLPDAAERLRQYDAAHAFIAANRYLPIGLDHFARADDALAQAARRGKLARNFQGYTTDSADALIGLGASAISAYPQGYAQNASDVPTYRAKIAGGGPATVRGRALTHEDRARRAIIERLMCDLEVDLDDIADSHGCPPGTFAPELTALRSLAEQGVVRIDRRRIIVPERARVAVRVVASTFDAYLQQSRARHAMAV